MLAALATNCRLPLVREPSVRSNNVHSFFRQCKSAEVRFLSKIAAATLPQQQQQQQRLYNHTRRHIFYNQQFHHSDHPGTMFQHHWQQKQQQWRWLSSSFSTSSTKPRPDPMARRPTAKCDPYGQGGKPLTLQQAQPLLATIEPDWTLVLLENNEEEKDASMQLENDDDNGVLEEPETETASASIIPFALRRDYYHTDYMHGAAFLQHVAAVAQMNDHYPFEVKLERCITTKRKQWVVRSRVTCRTLVLQGLSHHDFYVATLLDVECQRPEVQKLLTTTTTTTTTETKGV